MNERIAGRPIFDLLYANPQLFPHTHRKRPDGSIVAEYHVVIGPRSPVITLTVTIARDGTHLVATTVNGSPEPPPPDDGRPRADDHIAQSSGSHPRR